MQTRADHNNKDYRQTRRARRRERNRLAAQESRERKRKLAEELMLQVETLKAELVTARAIITSQNLLITQLIAEKYTFLARASNSSSISPSPSVVSTASVQSSNVSSVSYSLFSVSPASHAASPNSLQDAADAGFALDFDPNTLEPRFF